MAEERRTRQEDVGSGEAEDEEAAHPADAASLAASGMYRDARDEAQAATAREIDERLGRDSQGPNLNRGGPHSHPGIP